MDGEATDDIEMKELSEQEAGEQEGEDDTAFDDQRRDESILIIDGSNPVFTRLDDDTSTSEGPGGSVPNAGRDAGVMKRYMIHDMKQFLRNGLGITVNKGDGPSLTTLYDKTRTTTGKNGRINGAKYKGKKILILDRSGKMDYSKSNSKTMKPYVDEFKELLKKANREHQKTPAALVERRVGVDITQDTMNNIIDNVSDRIDSRANSTVEKLKNNTEITENELRELRGSLDPKGGSVADKLKALKIESDNWKEKAKEEGDTPKSKLYETIAEVVDLKSDELILRLNQKPVTEEVTKMVEEEAEENNMTKFEKFKKWSRENLLGLSSVAISVAGIITTAVVAGRDALKKGGEALKKLAKAVANKVKKLGPPALSALGTIISKMLELGGNGLLLLAKNLWMLAMAIAYLIYNEYVSNRSERRDRQRSEALMGTLRR